MPGYYNSDMSEVHDHGQLDFDGFLREQTAQAEQDNLMGLEQLRLTELLAARGVQFDDNEYHAATWLRDADESIAHYNLACDEFEFAHGRPLTAEDEESVMEWLELKSQRLKEMHRTVWHNTANVQHLAKLSVQVRSTLDSGLPIQVDFKKRLQAAFLATNCDEPWQSVIDENFPGESLDRVTDHILIDQAKSERAALIEQGRCRQEVFKSLFVTLYTDAEPGVIDTAVNRIITGLADRYTTLPRGTNAGRVVWAEEARAYLLKYGIPLTPGLQRIITYPG